MTDPLEGVTDAHRELGKSEGYAQAIDDAVAVAKRNHDYDTEDQIAALKEATDATPNI
jgi:hypothetical protein